MSSETFASRETVDPYRLPVMTPAEMIRASLAARKTYDDFMWNYVGDPSVQKRMQGHYPLTIGYDTKDGSFLQYSDAQCSGYTDLGYLVHVRIDPNQPLNDPQKRFFVVTGDLEAAHIEKRYVTEAEHDHNSRTGIITTTLYLYDEMCEKRRAAKKYWPHVRMDNSGFYYSPGRGLLEEKLLDVERLHTALIGSTALSKTIGRNHR